MAQKVAISLSDEELVDVQRILTDRDGEAALGFLREVVWHRAKAAARTLINPRQGTGALD
jgi:hypothetical protein